MPWTPWESAAAGAETVDLIAGEAIAAGQLVYQSHGATGTQGRVYLTDSDFDYASNKAAVIGIATTGASAGASVTVQYTGVVSGLSGLTAGLVYSPHSTPGALGANGEEPMIGVAESTTELRLTGVHTTSGLTAGVAYGANGSGVLTSGQSESIGYAISSTELLIRMEYGATQPQTSLWSGPAPLLFYRFDSNPGDASAVDSSGNSLNGTFRNAATPSYLASQTIGSKTTTVLDYTPASNGGIYAPTLPTTTVSTGTISAWINPDTTNNSEYLATLAESGGGLQGYLYFNSNKLYAYPVLSAGTVTIGSWEHWCWVRDGTSYTIYKNGAVSPDGASGTGTSFVRANTTIEFLVTSNNRAASFQYEGLLADLTMWDEALSAAQVLELYNSGTPLDIV